MYASTANEWGAPWRAHFFGHGRFQPMRATDNEGHDERGPHHGHGPRREGWQGNDRASTPWQAIPEQLFGPGGPFGPGGAFGPGGPFGGGGRGPRGRRGGPGGRARRGDVRTASLFLLAEGSMNGYQIIQALDERTDGAWRPSPGAVYPALSQLEDEGLIEAFEADGRKAFRLTDAGRREVESAGDRTKPWEFAREDERATTGAAGALWSALAQVGMATHAVNQSCDEDAARAATELLSATRKSLYRLLIDERDGAVDPEDADEDDSTDVS